MINSILSLSAALLLASGTPDHGQHQAHQGKDAAAAPQASTDKDPDQRICKRRSGGATGSRLGKSSAICKTRAEWDAERDASKRKPARATAQAADPSASAD